MEEQANYSHLQLRKENASFVQDVAAQYGLPIQKGGITYESLLSDKMLLVSVIRSGLPYSFFEEVQHYTPFNESDWAAFFDISTKSLQRYKVASEHRFKPIHSEKIIEMAEVTLSGLEVFGSSEKFRLWLNTPNYALGNQKPVELLRDSYGKEMVLSELVRINHGIFA